VTSGASIEQPIWLHKHQIPKSRGNFDGLVTGRAGQWLLQKATPDANRTEVSKGQFSFAGFRAKGHVGTGETAVKAASQPMR